MAKSENSKTTIYGKLVKYCQNSIKTSVRFLLTRQEILKTLSLLFNAFSSIYIIKKTKQNTTPHNTVNKQKLRK